MELVKCTHCNEDNTANAKYCRYCGYELPKEEPKNTLEQPVAKQPKSSSKKKLLVALVSVVAFVVAFFVVQQLVQRVFTFDKVLMKTASELNEACPLMVDAETRLDNAAAMPNNTFQYNYSLMTLVKDSIDISSFEAYLIPQITNNIKTNPDMELFRVNQVTMNYKYVDKNGIFVTKISIGPEQYNE
ncbi:zinc ribbon domain-containing protein [uncultured Draconibacterium sp.]|uniref:zinc ribbon domain-containing protein n=1 Tax=uncultured Draconibacterium sp. TaxID=1573823 RepID=UPI0029C6EBBF|nr:zinc ribbon domain-containing protein [uncultured Draconibacterium sp.]